jgi:hypothetical protein
MGLVSAQAAWAGEKVMLRAGDPSGPNAVFVFDNGGSSQKIIVRTAHTAVAGSEIEVRVDGSERPVFRHRFAPEDCKYVEEISKCETTIEESSPSFGVILFNFRRGSRARVTTRDAGVIKMDLTVGLSGFVKALRS